MTIVSCREGAEDGRTHCHRKGPRVLELKKEALHPTELHIVIHLLNTKEMSDDIFL